MVHLRLAVFLYVNLIQNQSFGLPIVALGRFEGYQSLVCKLLIPCTTLQVVSLEQSFVQYLNQRSTG